ncbi:hypothetical protein AsAng_0062540 [Aureispira anguillae]|uniref:Uncharacterized protein n=1 Tax=Aureispira anguillae TaxID=2864201 RepID=A0A915YLK1_9BACT|nr:hypothetical protein AsAng_0062540 [Aureispira anguillae]
MINQKQNTEREPFINNSLWCWIALFTALGISVLIMLFDKI